MFRKMIEHLISILLISQLTKGEDSSLQCGDWYVYKDEKCLKLFDNKEVKSYEDAKNTCYQNEGSSLVSIHSQEEQEFLFSLLTEVHQIVNDVWIGAHYKEKSFNWTDNTAVNYTHWSSGNPRNETGYECVIIGIVEPNRGKWVNEPCNKLNSFVCQKMQNWLYSYLQKTVMDLRETVKTLSYNLEATKLELQNTKTNSETQFKQLSQKVNEATLPGTIAYFANTTAPLGWLKANGQIVSRTTYANLFASIGTVFGSSDGSTTFTLPDLRGEFIRGWSDGRDVDINRVFGSFQWGSTIPFPEFIDGDYHAATASGMTNNRYFSGSTFDGGFVRDISPGVTRDGITYNSVVIDYAVTTKWGNPKSWTALIGTRPRNIALLACNKY